MPRFLNFFNFSLISFSIVIFITVYFISSSIPGKNFTFLDMREFYTAGKMINSGVTKDFYNVNTQLFWQNKIFHYASSSGLLPFFNPPFVAIFFSLPALTSYKNAYLIFLIFNATIVIFGMYLIAKGIPQIITTKRTLLLFLFTCFFPPLLYALSLGQLSCILFLSIVLGWYAFKQKNPFIAGLSLSLLLVKPQLILFPLLIIIFKKQWRALAGICTGIALLTIISIFSIGYQGMISYLKFLFLTPFDNYNYLLFSPSEPTLRGFLQLILHTNSWNNILIPLILGDLILTIFLVIVWKSPWKVENSNFDIQWSILTIIIAVTSLHTLAYDLTILLLPCVVFLQHIQKYMAFFLMIFIIDLIPLFFLLNTVYYFPFIVILLITLYQSFVSKGKT